MTRPAGYTLRWTWQFYIRWKNRLCLCLWKFRFRSRIFWVICSFV